MERVVISSPSRKSPLYTPNHGLGAHLKRFECLRHKAGPHLGKKPDVPSNTSVTTILTEIPSLTHVPFPMLLHLLSQLVHITIWTCAMQ